MSRKITKKIINTPESCVDDNLRGIVALYPKLQLYPKHRVITYRRKDDSGRVAILGGGGSGHEPFTAGLIGPGMLDGAVAGEVFASPPTGNVLYAIAQLYKYNSGGVLVLLGNYTGDRLNFGKAFEKAKIAGIKVEGFIVGEDVASSHNKTGGRSMSGEVFLYKMCGAMSAKGKDLYFIRDMAAEVNRNMATLGVCLSACSLPGQPPLFETDPDEMELGMGVHGEAGIQKLKLATAKETVTMLLDKIVEHLNLKAGNRVAALINNLGGTSLLEMNIIAAEVKEYLDKNQIKMERLYSGHLKTSLEMHGVQISLLHLNEQNGDIWLQLLDEPTDAAAWTGSAMSVGGGAGADDAGHEPDDTLLQSDEKKQLPSGPSLNKSEQELLSNCLKAAALQVRSKERLLNELDSGCGDGDCGITIKNFGNSILTYLSNSSLQHPSNVLWELSEIAEADMGGTSGGIYSLGLAAASQAMANAKMNDRKAWLNAWQSAMAAITKYGGAEPGDRTMLDTLHASSIVFEKNLNDDLKTLLTKANVAAEKGAQATADMKANVGRASYVSSEYLQKEDAGARGVAVWLNAIFDYIKENY